MKEEFEYEYDSDQERWRYYKKLYPSLDIELNNLHTKINRNAKINRYVGSFNINVSDGKVQLKHNNQNLSENIELSGDCFFNFKESNIIKLLNRIYGKNQPNDDLKSKLYKLSKNYFHSNVNCILMPRTGALNNVKNYVYVKDKTLKTNGKQGTIRNRFDRPDTFLCLLDEFYRKKNSISDLRTAGEFLTHSIFKAALEGENFTNLYDFLSSFEDVYSYCELFLGIGDDRDFFDRMIYEGTLPLDSENDVRRYIKLAEDYWNKKRTYYEMINKNSSL